MPKPDKEFERAIAGYLAKGMPQLHGLSDDAYVRKCRRAWDRCKTDEQFKFKVLVDTLYPTTLESRSLISSLAILTSVPYLHQAAKKRPRPEYIAAL